MDAPNGSVAVAALCWVPVCDSLSGRASGWKTSPVSISPLPGRLFYLFSPFSKDSHKYAPVSKISKNRPPLGAIVIGAKIKRLGVSPIGVKLLVHVGINTDMALT
jgi:hypothetical protein